MTAAVTGGSVPSRGLVLDVETRIDRRALRASGRRGTPRGMPTGLQVIVAAAMLSFDVGADGTCSGFTMRSAECVGSGEATLTRLLDRELARLHDDGGVLVTFNGGHDLSMIRLAALRHRHFGSGGATRWMADGGCHEDLMLGLGGAGARWTSLADMSAALGLHAPGEVILGTSETRPELAKCEMDVVGTMALYLNVLAERDGSDRVLRGGIPALATMIADRLDRSPHLQLVLGGRLFSDYAAH